MDGLRREPPPVVAAAGLEGRFATEAAREEGGGFGAAISIAMR